MHVLVALDCGGTLYSLVCHSRAAHARAGEEGLGGGVAGLVAGHERMAPWVCHLAVYGWASVPPGSGGTGGSQEQKAGEGCSAEGTGTGFLFDLVKKPRPARSHGGAGAWEGRGQGGRPGREMGMDKRMGASGTKEAKEKVVAEAAAIARRTKPTNPNGVDASNVAMPLAAGNSAGLSAALPVKGGPPSQSGPPVHKAPSRG